MADLLADALNIVKVIRISGRDECKVPASKITGAVLQILQKEKYVKEFEFVDDGKSGFFIVKGIGAINKCGVIKPRFAFKFDELAKIEEQYLPSKDFGILIISTPKGMITNQQLRDVKTGGRLIAYVY
jgi:small subunit ribosomal protein S8